MASVALLSRHFLWIICWISSLLPVDEIILLYRFMLPASPTLPKLESSLVFWNWNRTNCYWSIRRVSTAVKKLVAKLWPSQACTCADDFLILALRQKRQDCLTRKLDFMLNKMAWLRSNFVRLSSKIYNPASTPCSHEADVQVKAKPALSFSQSVKRALSMYESSSLLLQQLCSRSPSIFSYIINMSSWIRRNLHGAETNVCSQQLLPAQIPHIGYTSSN